MYKYYSKKSHIYNTYVTQKIYSKENVAEEILNEAVDVMKNFEKILNFYNEDSEVSNINNNSGKSFSVVSKSTFEIIESAKMYSELTEGAFDITIAPLVKNWGVTSGSPNILSDFEIAELLKLVNYKDIILNPKNNSVMLLKENQKIDLGGIAKGYIADKMIEFYKSKGISSAIINIGGNIKTLGLKDDSSYWKLGILEPEKNSNKCICSIESKYQSIVTAGVYERAFIYKGKLYPHIISPLTGTPIDSDLVSVTIVDDDSMKCDALSTPILIMGTEKGIDFMKRNNIKGILITKNKEIIANKSLYESIKVDGEYATFSF